MVYHLIAYNSNHSRCSNSMFIRTITFHNTITMILELAKFLTIRERRWFESISTSWEFISNTNPGRQDQRSPLVQLKYTFRGFAQRRIIRDNQLVGRLGLPCLWAHAWLPAHPYSASWLEWVIRPAKWEACVQNDKRASNDVVLNRHTWNHMS